MIKIGNFMFQLIYNEVKVFEYRQSKTFLSLFMIHLTCFSDYFFFIFILYNKNC